MIGLAAAEAVLASEAAAVSGLQRATKTTVSDSRTSKSVAARCPAGQNVIGGGGTVIGGRGEVVLLRLQPVQAAAGGRFVVAAREDETRYSSDWRLTAYAVCASTPPNLTTVSAASPASSARKSATVSCPAGTRVHSAGAQLGSAGGEPVSGSLVIDGVAIDPQLRTVTARAGEDETGTNDDWSVRAVALCAP